MAESQQPASLSVSPDDRTAIGITLGNSNSSIAFVADDKVEVIANEDGDRQIPTVLSYVNGDEYYGNQARNSVVRNPDNTVAYFREFIGQEFKDIDPTHCHASAHAVEVDGVVSFSVRDKAAQTPAETDDAEGAEPAEPPPPSVLSVSEVATRYLGRLVGAASGYLGRRVTSAVIAVPTNLSDTQRKALIEAARAADLEILQLLSDPAAAMLAHDAKGSTAETAASADKMVVVADLGGTRSDVSIVASRGGMYTILATAHDYEFVGVRLDQVLVEHFAREFMKKYPNAADPRSNPRSLARLRLEAEATKKALSLGANATFSIESLIDGFDFTSTINRVRYEMLGRTIFEGVNRLIDGAVKKAGLDVLDIDEVVLAGGTSHTPRIAANLAAIFPETTTIQAPATNPAAVNPSEMAVRGAALQASLIYRYDTDDIEQALHPAVSTVPHTPSSIGIIAVRAGAAGDETFTPIMAAQTALPARRAVQVPVPAEGGDVLVRIVEGGTHIKVTKPESKPKSKKKGKEAAATDSSDAEKKEEEDGNDPDDDGEDGDEDEDEDEDEEEEQRERLWKVGRVLAEAAIRGTKKGSRVEVTVSVGTEMDVTITAREMGAKGGVRGQIPPP